MKKYFVPILLVTAINISCEDECTPYLPQSSPGIEFTSVPPKGSHSDLRGRVRGVMPSEYNVIVFIRVNGGWWNKPYFSTPKTEIDCNSNYITDITTGGVDENADILKAFLVSKNYDPPLISGGALPESVAQNSLAWTEASR